MEVARSGRLIPTGGSLDIVKSLSVMGMMASERSGIGRDPGLRSSKSWNRGLGGGFRRASELQADFGKKCGLNRRLALTILRSSAKFFLPRGIATRCGRGCRRFGFDPIHKWDG
jgi:hypothetical protein